MIITKTPAARPVFSEFYSLFARLHLSCSRPWQDQQLEWARTRKRYQVCIVQEIKMQRSEELLLQHAVELSLFILSSQQAARYSLSQYLHVAHCPPDSICIAHTQSLVAFQKDEARRLSHCPSRWWDEVPKPVRGFGPSHLAKANISGYWRIVV